MFLRSLLLVLLLAPAGFAQQPPSSFETLEKAVREELAETRTPGAAVAVVSGDRVVFAKGFGVANVETGAPVTPETVFHVGSVSKMMTAAALVARAEAKNIRLDDTVGSYVPGLAPASYAGTYTNRWPMEIAVKEGKLVLELPIAKIGEHRFSVTPPGGRPQEFLIVPGTDGKAEYLQMFLWVFKRTG